MTTESAGGRTYKFGVGDRLRVAREVAGLSQDELAQLTGISRQTISNYELGLSKKPKPPYIAAIALATHFNRDWLEHGREPDDDGGGGQGVRREGIEPPTRWLGVSPFGLSRLTTDLAA